MNNFLERHPSIQPDNKRAQELEAFKEALAGAEAAIASRQDPLADETKPNQSRPSPRPNCTTLNQKQLEADAHSVIRQRHGDPDNEDLDED